MYLLFPGKILGHVFKVFYFIFNILPTRSRPKTSYSSTVILIFFFCFRKTGFHLGMSSFSKVVPSALNTPLLCPVRASKPPSTFPSSYPAAQAFCCELPTCCWNVEESGASIQAIKASWKQLVQGMTWCRAHFFNVNHRIFPLSHYPSCVTCSQESREIMTKPCLEAVWCWSVACDLS